MIEFLGRWLLFVCLNLLAAGNAVILAVALKSQDEPAKLLTSWLTLFLAQIVLVETTLGLVGWLTSWNTLVVLTIVFAVLVFIHRFQKMPRLSPLVAEDFRAALGTFRERKDLAVIAFLAAWIVAGLGLTALTKPSTFPDTLSYHLPEVVHWIQSRSPAPFELMFADMSNSYFPANGGFLYFWMMAPFRSDLMVRLTNLAMWMVLGVSLFRMGRLCGASAEASLSASLLLLFTPVALGQTMETSLDVASAALFFLALGHLVEFAGSQNWQSALLFVLSAGLFMGMKYSAPAYLILLVLAFAVFMIRMVRRRQIAGWLALSYAVIGAVGAIALGGFGYIRNVALTGNPIYPIALSLGRWTLPGAYSTSYYQFNRLWQRWQDIPSSVLTQGVWRGTGPVLPALFALAVLLLGWRLMHGKGTSRWTWLIALLGATLIIYLDTPYSVMISFPAEPIARSMQVTAGMRFGLITFSLCAIFVALGIGMMPGVQRIIWLLLGVSIALSIFTFQDRPTLWVESSFSSQLAFGVLAIILLVFSAWWQRERLLSVASRPRRLVLTVVVATFVVGAVLYVVEEYREHSRYAVYQSAYGDIALDWQWIAENIRGAKIALVGSNQSYPLYGRHFENQVGYFELSTERDNYASWLQRLESWQAQYLVFNGAPLQETWAREHPETFGSIFKGTQLDVYRVYSKAIDRSQSHVPASLQSLAASWTHFPSLASWL
jgi:hypothetical protein